MRCPYCETELLNGALECPACRLDFPKTMPLLGAMPRISAVVSDSTGKLTPAETAKLKRVITRLTSRFEGLHIQVVLHHFPAEHPFSLHAFWMFNAGSIGGNMYRGGANRGILLAIDPARGEAAIILGYGLENLLPRTALDHLLEMASPLWAVNRWADGIHRVLDGFEQLFDSVAQTTTSGLPDNEF